MVDDVRDDWKFDSEYKRYKMTSQSSLLPSPTLSNKFQSSRTSSTTNIYKSLEHIQNNLNDLDNFLTITEDILRRERDLDRDLYKRERERKGAYKKFLESPVVSRKPPPLVYHNGKISCVDDDKASMNNKSNVQLTHEIVKEIIKNQIKMCCYDKTKIVPQKFSSDSSFEDLKMSDDADIFKTCSEIENTKLKSLKDLLFESSTNSTTSSRHFEEDILPVVPTSETLDFVPVLTSPS